MNDMADTANLAEKDYFTDLSVLLDPYSYFNEIRSRSRIYDMQSRDAMIVTGFAEAVEIMLDADHFSAYRNTEPDKPLPFEPEGDDISHLIDTHRGDNPMLDLMVNYDGERHTAARSLLNSLFKPSRLKANKEYMQDLANEMVDEIVGDGKCELISKVATPFVTLVIADLLGVPAEDREKFMEVIANGVPAGNMDQSLNQGQAHPLLFMAQFFVGYVADRRANPREDVLTELSTQTYPDGTLPDAMEIVKAAMFLFAAGQDTSAKLLGNSIRYMVDNKDMQDKLRADPSLIPDFIEEMLRIEGSTKATFRVCAKSTSVGGVDIPAGKRIIVALSAANRDPERWEDPNEFKLGRPKIKEHVAFSRGAHTCIGAPLARAEVQVMLETLLAKTSDISLSLEHHGDPGENRLKYEPSFIIRGLEEMHIELTPAT